MNNYNKYLKYKKKYLEQKNKNKNGGNLQKISQNKNGGGLQQMPKICFGTVHNNLEQTLESALTNGYRHIDGAECYGGPVYKEIIKNKIKIIPREELWITWKDDDITLKKIITICSELDCDYIDLFLVHHNCGTSDDFVQLKIAQAEGFIKHYGVSNCEDFDTIKRLKREHKIFANQIQARPPLCRVSRREMFNPPNFIEECNKIGVKIMLFSTINGITSSEIVSDKIYEYLFSPENLINKYYIQKYILGNDNVLIVSSQSGSSIVKNISDFNNTIHDINILPVEKMLEIENNLSQIVLALK